jgi:dihydrofolate reductase
MQGSGTPVPGVAENGVFDRSGWAHFDHEAGKAMDDVFLRADAFLFGRLTYQMFAGSWGTWGDPGNSPIWTALHTKPKYVVSDSLTNPQWSKTTVLSGDLAANIHKLKAEPGRELQVHGSGVLIRWLLDNNCVDEMTMFTFPVIIGRGTRLFPDNGKDNALDMIDSQTSPSGVMVKTYRITGRPKYAE